ncbi:MAG: hypothetical protein ACRC2S_09755 [Waterburya sp.]
MTKMQLHKQEQNSNKWFNRLRWLFLFVKIIGWLIWQIVRILGE